RELPAQLAALLQIDGALGGDALVQALVEGGLVELGLEVVDPPVGRLDVADDLVERGRLTGRRSRGWSLGRRRGGARCRSRVLGQGNTAWAEDQHPEDQ